MGHWNSTSRMYQSITYNCVSKVMTETLHRFIRQLELVSMR